MIYFRLEYFLILHHQDHMHNTNHKDFSRVVMGFRIKVGNIQELQLKSHRNQWSKNESTQTQIYKTCKTNHSIQQLPHLYISCINRPISWNFRRNYEHGQFVTLKTISSITSFLFFFEFFFLSFFSPKLHQQWNSQIENENMFQFNSHSHTTNPDTPTLISCTPIHIIMMNNAPLALQLG